jgi:hypothetical protein
MCGMNEEKIIKILKDFSAIKPDEDFVRRSRPLILANSPKPRLSGFKQVLLGFKTGPVLIAAALLLLIIFGGYTYLNSNKTQLAGLDDDLLVESANLDFDIHLKEARYFDESIKEVATILEKVSGSAKNGPPL